MYMTGSLRSSGITRYQRYYEPRRLPSRPHGQLCIPAQRRVRPFAYHRTPRHARVSQVPGTTIDARRPQPPRTARRLHMPVASSPIVGFAPLDGLATADCVTRLNRVHACALRLTSSHIPELHRSGLPKPMSGLLHVKQAIYMANSFQFASCAKLHLAYPMHANNTKGPDSQSFAFIRAYSRFISFPVASEAKRRHELSSA